MKVMYSLFLTLLLISCSDGSDESRMQNDQKGFADVIEVEVNGRAGAYRFAVTISSPDTGCDQYADWWEIISENGELIHRRILLHSHVDEQPFTRTGVGIDITENQVVYIRAHMNNTGYGGQVLKGSVKNGFEIVEIDEGFASELENAEPQPGNCAF